MEKELDGLMINLRSKLILQIKSKEMLRIILKIMINLKLNGLNLNIMFNNILRNCSNSQCKK